MDSFHIRQKWTLTCGWVIGLGGVVHDDLWTISSRSFSQDFATKLIRYGTSWGVCSIAFAVLDGLFPYLAIMIASKRGCVNMSYVKVTRAIQVFAVWAEGISRKWVVKPVVSICKNNLHMYVQITWLAKQNTFIKCLSVARCYRGVFTYLCAVVYTLKVTHW